MMRVLNSSGIAHMNLNATASTIDLGLYSFIDERDERYELTEDNARVCNPSILPLPAGSAWQFVAVMRIATNVHIQGDRQWHTKIMA
jgi:hypothetical protein